MTFTDLTDSPVEPRRRARKPRAQAEPTEVVIEKPPKAVGKLDDKGARVESLKRSIKQDLNPVLVQGFAALCNPVPSENFYGLTASGTVSPTPLGREVMLEGWSVELLARAGAELESSPILTTITTVAGPFLPIAYGVGAAVVLALHTRKVLAIRDQVLLSWQANLAAQAGKDQGQNAQTQTPSTNGSGAPLTPDFTEGAVA